MPCNIACIHKTLSDKCEMDISFRFYDMDFANQIEKNTREICQSIAEKYGGNVELGCTAHRNDFMIDEEGMKSAIQAFCTYVMSFQEE